MRRWGREGAGKRELSIGPLLPSDGTGSASGMLWLRSTTYSLADGENACRVSVLKLHNVHSSVAALTSCNQPNLEIKQEPI